MTGRNDIWRIVFQDKLPGEESMQLDASLLNKAKAEEFTPLLRFYDWLNPTLTIGYGQPRSDINIKTLERDGIDFAVRPTGGRAVLHWDEVTYSIILPAGHPMAGLSVIESYRIISKGLSAGLKKLGIDARVTKGESGGHRNPSCFSSASRYEVVVERKKLIGSAQRRKHGALLQQGSIPVGPQFRKLGDYLLNAPMDPELAEKAICIAEVTSELPTKKRICNCLAEGLSEKLGFDYRKSPDPKTLDVAE